MSQASMPISLNTKFMHPITNHCPDATAKYFEWSDVAKLFKKGSKQFEAACLRYKWHIAKCAVCREGSDAA